MSKICLRCGHEVCEGCGNWCDVILNPGKDGAALKEDVLMDNGEIILDFDACCDGQCVYTEEELKNDNREFIKV